MEIRREYTAIGLFFMSKMREYSPVLKHEALNVKPTKFKNRRDCSVTSHRLPSEFDL